MKKIIITLLALIALASCGAKQPDTTQTGTTSTETSNTTTSTGTDLSVETGHVVSVYYSLRDTDENGEIIDSNMDESGIPTKPALSVGIGAGDVIPGFEKALLGMKVGETKTVAVAPEDGYTPRTTTEEIPYEDIAPLFSITEEKSSIMGIRQQEIPLTEVDPSLLEGKNNGDIITEHNGTNLKLIEKKENSIVVEFQQTNSPFYGKELKVGMSAEVTGITFKITKIEGENVTLEVLNTNSPFYNKDGGEQKIEAGNNTEIDNNGNKIAIKILEINEVDGKKTVKIEQTMTPKLAGKTLYFTIKVDSIKPLETPTLDLSSLIPTTTETSETTEKPAE